MSWLKNNGFDWLAWLFFLVVPLVILHQSATSLVEQGAGSGGPLENAAIFPKIVAWAMLSLGAMNGLGLLFSRGIERSPFEGTSTTRLALLSTGLVVLYLFAMPVMGYHIATPVLLAALMRLFGLGWLRAALGAVAMSLGVAAIFEGFLNVVLPVGVFGLAVFV